MKEFVPPPNSDQFGITAHWRPRGESPECLAERWVAMTERLAALSPMFGKWFAGRRSIFEVSRQNQQIVLEDILENVHTMQDGHADSSFGYYWHAGSRSDGKWGPQYVSLSAHAGGRRSMFFESVTLETDPFHEADPRILNYGIFKDALLAVAESFDTDEAIAFPKQIIDLWPAFSPDRPRLRPAWMTYVAARFAPLVSPPRTALVERRPDGGLFMAATTGRFSTSNRDHMRAANEIAASAPTFKDTVPDSGKFGQADVVPT